MRLATKMDLTSQLLIAMPGMADHNFSQTINLVCWHDQHGAMGLVLNRPSEQPIADLLQPLGNGTQLERNMQLRTQHVFIGGPVADDQIFVLYTDFPKYDDSISLDEDLLLCSSTTIIDAISNGDGPEKFMIFLGYCGWGVKQLDDEINRNAWLTVDADADLIFETPAEQQWQAAASKLGIDINLMSSNHGNA